MKRKFNFLLIAALVCGMGVGVTSCSDDDSNNDSPDVESTQLTFDNDLLVHGLETDIESAVLEVPVKSDGPWTATLRTTKDGNDIPEWAKILDWEVVYTGDKTLKINVDANLAKIGRTCYLVLGNGGDDYKVINIYQNTKYKGEDATNSSGEAFADLGVGTGIFYDYLLNMKNKVNETREFVPSMVHGVNNIFNISRIQELQASGELNRSAYVEAPLEMDNLKAALLDTSIVQSKRCSVSVELGVDFGVISFKGKGMYNSTKDEATAHVDYTLIRQAPMYNIYMSPAELTNYAGRKRTVAKDTQSFVESVIEELIESYKKKNQQKVKRGKLKAEDLDDQGLTDEQADEIDCMYDNIPVEYDFGGIFSTAFSSRYNQLYNAITRQNLRGKKINEKEVENILGLLDTEFGPFYIDGGNFGGLMVVHARVDTMSMKGITEFGGKATLEVMGGACTLDASFTYTEEGYNAWHKIRPEFHIYGGNATDTSTELLRIISSGNPNDMKKWQGVLINWISSMESPDGIVDKKGQSKAQPITFIIQPIWQLFDEPDIHAYVKDYFMKKYQDRGIVAWEQFCTGGITPKADDLLNVNSDFWKKYGGNIGK